MYTQEGWRGFLRKKFLFLIQSIPEKAAQDFDKKSFAVLSIQNSGHQKLNK